MGLMGTHVDPSWIGIEALGVWCHASWCCIFAITAPMVVLVAANGWLGRSTVVGCFPAHSPPCATVALLVKSTLFLQAEGCLADTLRKIVSPLLQLMLSMHWW